MLKKRLPKAISELIAKRFVQRERHVTEKLRHSEISPILKKRERKKRQKKIPERGQAVREKVSTLIDLDKTPTENPFISEQNEFVLSPAEPEKKRTFDNDVLRFDEGTHGFEFRTNTKRYTHVKELARGAYGVTYEALDENLNIPVVIKVQFPYAEERDISAFDRERKILARFSHMNIARIYEGGRLYLGDDEEGNPQYALCHITRKYEKTLKALIEEKPRRTPEEPRQTPEEGLELAENILAEIADGIQVAHEHGIIHRDIKPGNIVINSEGVPKLIDFGLAFDKERHQEQLEEEAGDILGTPFYMAPEHLFAETQGDESTDWYSFAATCYHDLTGETLIGRKELEMEDIVHWNKAYSKRGSVYRDERRRMRKALSFHSVGPHLSRLIMRLLRPDRIRKRKVKINGKVTLVKSYRVNPGENIPESIRKAVEDDRKLLARQRKKQRERKRRSRRRSIAKKYIRQ